MGPISRPIDHVAVVTGGGTGIGAATARRLAADGWSVVVTGRRAGPIDAVAAEVGGLAVVADTASESDWAGVVAATHERFGPIAALVANAGIEAFGSASELTMDDWRRVQEVNVDGVLLAVRAVLADLQASAGSITIVSSVAGMASGPHYAAYVTSKTAVLGLMRSLAVDLGPAGVRVNAVCPGWTRTEMAERETDQMAAAAGIDAEEMWLRLTRYLPLRRAAAAAEIAATIAFLAGSDATFVTGTALVVDGGGSAVDVGTLAFGAEPWRISSEPVPTGSDPQETSPRGLTP
jgi:NAD(P)-dependent dehydrogenase (short-subunit alcohol dehydrogenase family)